MILESEKELLEYIDLISYRLDAIVVEGYDGVGKGRVLNCLSDKLGVIPYRPDYNMWQSYDHRIKDRWKVSGFFWDIFSHFNIEIPTRIMLFDRGVISGAVYLNDMNIAKDYPKMIRSMRILHILVTCDLKDHERFHRDRGATEYNIEEYNRYRLYTQRYVDSFEIAGVEYIKYHNKYSEELSNSIRGRCVSCGHYSYGFCRHPDKNYEVDGMSRRCDLFSDKEVQDTDAAEMQCV